MHIQLAGIWDITRFFVDPKIKRGRTALRHVPSRDVVRVKTLTLDPSGQRCSSQERVHHLGRAGYRQFIRSPFFHRVLPSEFPREHLLYAFAIRK
jgi:hypothetical protein